MGINKAYKFRVYPTKEQIEFFDNSVRTNNFIYNYFLREQEDISEELTMLSITNKEDRKKMMKDNNLYYNKFAASKVITTMKKDPEYYFLKDINSTMPSYTLKALELAFKNMIKTGSGFPQYKNRNSRYSFIFQFQYSNNLPKGIYLNMVSKKRGYIKLPKIGDLEIIPHIDFFVKNWNIKDVLKLNSCTITKEGDKYFVSFQGEEVLNNSLPKKDIIKDKAIGIDLGVDRPITTSREEDFNNPIFAKKFNLLKEHKEKLHQLSSILNRKRDYHKKNKTGVKYWETNSYKRVHKKIRNLHFKISQIRSNIQHNITKQLSEMDGVDTFILEDLNVKGMTKRSAKGKSNKKSNLNRVINDVGFNSLKEKLVYKCEKLGKNVETIDPKFTSQTCSSCGNIDKKSRKSQSKFVCTSCGHTQNADLNAANNIKEKFFK